MLPSWPQANQLPRNQPRVTQHHDISIGNHSVRLLHLVLDSVANCGLQNAEAVRQGSYSPIIDLPRQTLASQSCNLRGVGSRSQKARCKSPQRRGTKEKELSVSFLSIRINFAMRF
jgi:hypothetical protein